MTGPTTGGSDGSGEADLPLIDPSGSVTGADDRDDSVVDAGADERHADAGDRPRSQVAGVLLAAGTGSRFGDANKLLATLDGEPLVRHAARTLLDAGLDPVVAVVGHEGDRVAGALDGVGVRVVENDAYREGQATSVRAGVEALGPDVDAVVFALGDMPRVDPASVRALVDVYEESRWTALAAAVAGERGNPVLFDRTHFDALVAVSGDRGGRHVLRRGDRSALVETGDPGVRRDVDTPADLDSLD
jgi:molybdenum cofactor cytidylyltransferase